MPVKPFQLKPDYSKPYKPYDPGTVHKEPFLKDARTLLRQVAGHLSAAGMDTLQLYTNRGGPAVSGDAIGYFSIDLVNCIEIFVGVSVVGRERADKVTVMARVSEYELEQRGKKTLVQICRMGTNVWLNPNANARRLAQQLMALAGGQGYAQRAIAVDTQGRSLQAFAYGIDPGLDAASQPAQLDLFSFAPNYPN